MIWVGLDLHKRYITACALDEAGVVVAEHRRLPAEAEALVAWLTGVGGAVTVAMEATLYWTWLQDQLIRWVRTRDGSGRPTRHVYPLTPALSEEQMQLPRS